MSVNISIGAPVVAADGTVTVAITVTIPPAVRTAEPLEMSMRPELPQQPSEREPSPEPLQQE
jgi:hypothetical protein